MKKINYVIQFYRKKKGYTLKDLSARVGVSEATVQRWESGAIPNIRYHHIIKLADALEIHPAVLMGWSTEEKEPVSEEGVKKGTIQIAGRDGSFVERELTDDQIDIVKRMVDQMPVFRRSTNHLKSPPENQTPLYPLFPDPSSPINYWDDRHTSTQMLADDPFPLTPPKQNRKTPPEDDET